MGAAASTCDLHLALKVLILGLCEHTWLSGRLPFVKESSVDRPPMGLLLEGLARSCDLEVLSYHHPRLGRLLYRSGLDLVDAEADPLTVKVVREAPLAFLVD